MLHVPLVLTFTFSVVSFLFSLFHLGLYGASGWTFSIFNFRLLLLLLLSLFFYLPFSFLRPCAGSRDLVVLPLHDRASGIGVFYMMEGTSI